MDIFKFYSGDEILADSTLESEVINCFELPTSAYLHGVKLMKIKRINDSLFLLAMKIKDHLEVYYYDLLLHTTNKIGDNIDMIDCNYSDYSWFDIIVHNNDILIFLQQTYTKSDQKIIRLTNGKWSDFLYLDWCYDNYDKFFSEIELKITILRNKIFILYFKQIKSDFFLGVKSFNNNQKTDICSILYSNKSKPYVEWLSSRYYTCFEVFYQNNDLFLITVNDNSILVYKILSNNQTDIIASLKFETTCAFAKIISNLAILNVGNELYLGFVQDEYIYFGKFSFEDMRIVILFRIPSLLSNESCLNNGTVELSVSKGIYYLSYKTLERYYVFNFYDNNWGISSIVRFRRDSGFSDVEQKDGVVFGVTINNESITFNKLYNKISSIYKYYGRIGSDCHYFKHKNTYYLTFTFGDNNQNKICYLFKFDKVFWIFINSIEIDDSLIPCCQICNFNSFIIFLPNKVYNSNHGNSLLYFDLKEQQFKYITFNINSFFIKDVHIIQGYKIYVDLTNKNDERVFIDFRIENNSWDIISNKLLGISISNSDLVTDKVGGLYLFSRSYDKSNQSGNGTISLYDGVHWHTVYSFMNFDFLDKFGYNKNDDLVLIFRRKLTLNDMSQFNLFDFNVNSLYNKSICCKIYQDLTYQNSIYSLDAYKIKSGNVDLFARSIFWGYQRLENIEDLTIEELVEQVTYLDQTLKIKAEIQQLYNLLIRKLIKEKLVQIPLYIFGTLFGALMLFCFLDRVFEWFK